MLSVDGMKGAAEKDHFSNFSRLTDVAEGAGSKCENEGSPSEGLLVVAGVSVEDFQLPSVQRILIDGPNLKSTRLFHVIEDLNSNNTDHSQSCMPFLECMVS